MRVRVACYCLLLRSVAGYHSSHGLPAERRKSGILLSAADAKAALLEEVKYNKPLLNAGKENFDLLVQSDQQASGCWWTGKFVLKTCNGLTRFLRKITGPLLDGAPVTITVDDTGAVHIETDMLVVGCATGLRMFGSAEGTEGGAATVVMGETHFFEPSEEFGITKALNKCEEQLRPKLPGGDAPMRAVLEPLFEDNELVLVNMKAEGLENVPLVLAKVRDDDMQVMRARRG